MPFKESFFLVLRIHQLRGTHYQRKIFVYYFPDFYSLSYTVLNCNHNGVQYVVINDGIIRKCWNYWCFTASRVYISAYSVITFSGADNHFNLPFTISAALVKVEGNTGLESKCYVQPFHPIRYCSLIIFSKKQVFYG